MNNLVNKEKVVLFNEIMGILSGAFDGTMDFIDTAMEKLNGFLQQTGVSGLITDITNAINGAGGVIGDVINAVVNAIGQVTNAISGALGEIGSLVGAQMLLLI